MRTGDVLIERFPKKPSIVRVSALLFFMLVIQGFGEDESEKQPTITYGIETDVIYQYIWRGIGYNRGLLAQPYAWISTSDFTASTWCNYTLFDADDAVKQHEVDLILQYDRTFGDFTIGPSINIYSYPNETRAPATGELALNFGYSVNNWEFSTTHYIDFMEYRGAYFGEAGFEYSRTTTNENVLHLGMNLGWASERFNKVYSGLSKATLSNLVFSCSYEYGLTESVYLQPYFDVYHNINSSLQKINHTNLFNIGLIIGFGV